MLIYENIQNTAENFRWAELYNLSANGTINLQGNIRLFEFAIKHHLVLDCVAAGYMTYRSRRGQVAVVCD